MHPCIHASINFINPSINTHASIHGIDLLMYRTSSTLPIYWCIRMQCLSIDLCICQCIHHYLSVYLPIHPCLCIPNPLLHRIPSILHSFLPFVHPQTLHTLQSRTQWTIFETTQKKLHGLRMDSLQHTQVKLLDVSAPEGLPPSPASSNGNGPISQQPSTPSTVNARSIEFLRISQLIWISPALVLSLPITALIKTAAAGVSKAHKSMANSRTRTPWYPVNRLNFIYAKWSQLDFNFFWSSFILKCIVYVMSCHGPQGDFWNVCRFLLSLCSSNRRRFSRKANGYKQDSPSNLATSAATKPKASTKMASSSKTKGPSFENDSSSDSCWRSLERTEFLINAIAVSQTLPSLRPCIFVSHTTPY